ncbi:MAG: hypothetical protein HYV09_29365 [Deltaproteobacteria bacterium]|nr:hypothetical protein [Deltaproteobacteria bacterium]
MRVLLTMVAGASLLLSAPPALASPFFPDEVRARLGLSAAPPCLICHDSLRGGLGTVVKPFGRAMIARGLVVNDRATVGPALSKMEADNVDSDHDGTPDIAALRAGRDPNGLFDLSAPPVEYGCGATFGRAPRDGAWVALATMAGALLRRRRMRRADRSS